MSPEIMVIFLINFVLILVTMFAYFRHMRSQRRRDQKYRPDPIASRRRKKRPTPPPQAD